jgi:transcriptional regulator of acetoin/glycerol metabolism
MLSGLLDWGYTQDVSAIQGPLFEAWQRFLEGDALEEGFVRPVIFEAWERCRANEVDFNLEAAPVAAAPANVTALPATPSILVKEATPAMTSLGKVLHDNSSIAALCDKSGRILAIEGDPVFADRVAEHKNFRVGARWSEEATGNNAIGTALSTGQPHQVFSAEHYCRAWHDYVCTAVPIYDPFSEKMLGVLDITGTISNFHRHAYGQILHLVRLIETALFRKGLAREYLFNREVLRAMNSIRSEALVIADASGAVRVCTDAAREMLRDIPLAGEDDLTAMVQRLSDQRQLTIAGTFETMVRIAGSALAVRVSPLIHNKVLLGTVVRFSDCRPSPVRPLKTVGHTKSYPIIGNSPALAKARRKAEKVAPFDSTVLLEGESGTGKELFARLIHNFSPRSQRPFIALNCAAIPPDLMASELFGYESGSFTGACAGGQTGKLEIGNRGTIFLDEISEIPLTVQAILLRFLQEKEFYRVGGTRLVRPDVRIIAATNKPLRNEMAAGRFRKDLFYRLKVVTIELPPLDRRHEDIPPLVDHFLKKLGDETGRPVKTLDEESMAAVAHYAWPGNVRELQNAVEHAFVMSEGDRIRLRDLPEEIVSPGNLEAAVTPAGHCENERDELLLALERHNWNVSLTARSLGLARVTLYRRMKRHGITVVKHLSRP